MRCQTRRVAFCLDPEIHQPPAQVVFFNPLGHLRVNRVGHQHRKAKVVQQALDGALPVALFISHLQQLACKGHGFFSEPQGAANRGAHGDLLRRNIAAAAFEAGDFVIQRSPLGPALGKLHTEFGQTILGGGRFSVGRSLQLQTGLALGQQVFGIGDLQQAQAAAQVVIT